jgi:acyl-coenzyme A thioesterase PaaI-like protein
MAVFHRDEQEDRWIPSDLARGPFAGLQGGAIAGLMIAEAERFAAREGRGAPVHVATWFLRPAPAAPLRIRSEILHASNRLTVIDVRLHDDAGERLLALARVTVARPRRIELTLASDPPSSVDPASFPLREIKAPHGGAWFMDAMEARQGNDGIAWFRMTAPVVDGAGPLATVAGPADWSHGIARPLSGVAADPNSNLNVHLLRPPRDGWVGIDARARWLPADGTGVGTARLLDVAGDIGAVSMSVMLSPFPAASGVSPRG